MSSIIKQFEGAFWSSMRNRSGVISSIESFRKIKINGMCLYGFSIALVTLSLTDFVFTLLFSLKDFTSTEKFSVVLLVVWNSTCFVCISFSSSKIMLCPAFKNVANTFVS